MKFKKGAVADVLWFIALTTIFIIITRTQLEFSSTGTIDSYAKNIVNAEVTRLVSNISGYSLDSTTCNMYNTKGVQRNYGLSSDMARGFHDNDASSQGIVNFAKKDMKENIRKSFEQNETLKTRTKGIASEDIDIQFESNTSKSTRVTVIVNYTVVASGYQAKTGGFVEKDEMSIPRKISVTRIIENPLRFNDK